MQPIFHDSFLTVFLSVLGFIAIGAVGAFLATTKNSSKKRIALGMALVVASFVGMVVTPLIVFVLGDARENDERLTEVQRVYGLDISTNDFHALKYPTSQPSEDFRAYGTATITTEQENGELEQKRLTLVWQDKEFRLFQGEGAIITLDELPRSGR